jgi:hypothetical protein
VAADLRVVAGWQGAGGSMAGGLTLINKGTSTCSLQGRPGIHLIDGQGNLMPVANVKYTEEPAGGTPANSGAPVTLRPGGKAFVFFVWANWCLQAQGPFKLAVALPGGGGQLTAPVQDPKGAPVSTTPRCDDAGTASTISIGEFR